MYRYTRTLTTTVGAALLLAFAVSGATARNLSISNQNIRIAWSVLEFRNNLGQATIRCPITVEGSFHARSSVKSANTLVGFVTRGIFGTCTESRATILQETLPWHVTYQGFSGTLPRIVGITINLIGAGFDIEPAGSGNRCRARTSTLSPASGIVGLDSTGRVTGLRADESRNIPLTNVPGGFLCGFGSGSSGGTATVTLLGNTTPITVTLI